MSDIFQLNLRHLDALLVTGRSGSMSAAAREVNLSQPALAQAVSPTTAGRVMMLRIDRALHYLAHGGRLMLSELRAGLEEIRAMNTDDAGRITVGILPSARAIFFSDLLARFITAHVSAAVKVVEAPYRDLLACRPSPGRPGPDHRRPSRSVATPRCSAGRTVRRRPRCRCARGSSVARQEAAGAVGPARVSVGHLGTWHSIAEQVGADLHQPWCGTTEVAHRTHALARERDER